MQRPLVDHKAQPHEDQPPLTAAQLSRYQRQLILPGFGIEAQHRLRAGRVLIVGAGGLGSPAALYLAAAGVGTIGMVDGDRVDLSNLHRQILHDTVDVGRPKTETAARRLRALNPDVVVVEHRDWLTRDNVWELLGAYDVIVNGADNFPTRYLLSDAAVYLKKPLVDAAILRFEGQLTVFMPGRGCYRCLFPAPPPPGLVPNCAEGGILGVVAGIMGTAQAAEALKILSGVGSVAAGRLQLYDALMGEWRVMTWNPDPDCNACGPDSRLPDLPDYDAFCGVPGPAGTADRGVPALDPEEAHRRMREAGAVLWDVRSPAEYKAGHVPGSVNVPYEDWMDMKRLGLPREGQSLLVICATGIRSARAVGTLAERFGYPAVHVQGGLLAWTNAQLPWTVSLGATSPIQTEPDRDR